MVVFLTLHETHPFIGSAKQTTKTYPFLPATQETSRVCICLFFFFFLTFWLCLLARGILVPRPGIEPAPPAVEAQSLNHRSTREMPAVLELLYSLVLLYIITHFLGFIPQK